MQPRADTVSLVLERRSWLVFVQPEIAL